MTPARQPVPAPARRSGAMAGMAAIAALFALVYARSLTFVYIEGDDATSIAYHALGRLRSVQPPYSAYQSMMDAALALLPAREPVLRAAAMSMTALAAPVLVFLIAALAYDWLGSRICISWPAAALLVPLAAPELIYLGLVYTPAMVALAAAVGAHLLARAACRHANRGAIARAPRFWASAVLFGAGVACRWDVVAYGAMVAADLWMGPGLGGPRRRRFPAAPIWGLAALGAWLGAVWANGFSPDLVWKIVRTAGPVETYPGLAAAAAAIQTLATPALVLFAALGFILLARRRHPLCLLVLMGLGLTVRYIPFGVPKWFLVATPALAACALAGFSAAWGWRGGAAPLLRVALAACVAAPWLIGVQTLFGDSAYGPGFQVRPFDRPVHRGLFVRPLPGAGALVPTSEGARPLGGHAWVLLGGWRRIARERADDLSHAAAEAASASLPILQDYGQGLLAAELAGMGYYTRDSWKQEVRTFLSVEGGRPIRVVRLRDREDLFTPAGQARVEKMAGGNRLVAFAYTSTLRRLYRTAPLSLHKLGATAAVLDLGILRETADKMADGAR